MRVNWNEVGKLEDLTDILRVIIRRSKLEREELYKESPELFLEKGEKLEKLELGELRALFSAVDTFVNIMFLINELDLSFSHVKFFGNCIGREWCFPFTVTATERRLNFYRTSLRLGDSVKCGEDTQMFVYDKMVAGTSVTDDIYEFVFVNINIID